MISQVLADSDAHALEPGYLKEFFQKTLDSLPSHIAILRDDGAIIAVNAPWRAFALGNGLMGPEGGPGANYLQVCESATGDCSEEASEVANGIRAVIQKLIPNFQLEYPCHSPTMERWFTVRVTRFDISGEVRVIVTHDDITQMKLTEFRLNEVNEVLKELAATDGMTGLTNRRGFDAALAGEWKRCQRANIPLSLILLDVDHFKRFNDAVGHLAGDDCLREIAAIIKASAGRPGDVVARYGGEEFVVILPGTDREGANVVCHSIASRLLGRGLEHPDSPTSPLVTLSIGCATVVPVRSNDPESLVGLADEALYLAKQAGRNRTVHAEPAPTV